MKGILGTKVGMTQVWKGDKAIPVTVILAGPCPVVQRKTTEKDGYEAVQLGFQSQKSQRVNKPLKGHFAKAGIEPVRYLRELRGFNPEGNTVTVSIFNPGEVVDVTGTSKGHGFTGVMKKWNFAGGYDSHGAHKVHRHGGSIGNRKTPGRVFKGKKMAGRWGNEKVTIQGLEVVDVLEGENLILVKGSVPGANGSLVVVRQTSKVPALKAQKGGK
ncbi:MAG: 50S ribosomal protein L3 [Meiothermus sp.]|uniref:50S ribosomal protein L3 n=1 Tax=Meiothermus sp. TaxID=1955249 RepID=UPI0025E47B7C|nr:50S ribosomal protein L3 [Meiothermus sp.]MCS7067422.1 50S ribosomal protein L3 [Meiothermus sp.]MCX7602148.1 50S ribosomal protein L3 [Meiothermus sp.]MDW8425353.1 50S ribosomal protein L3 [Meiothermus sp.]